MGSRARAIARVVALTACLASPAFAIDPSAADRESARAYMADGRSKRDANDLRAALRAFEAADAIMHVPTTALEVARTQAMLGLLVEARDGALGIARQPAKPGEPAPFAEARAAAQKLANELEERIPSIRVTLVRPPPGLVVSVDGRQLPAVAIGLPRKLDPGAHVIVARAGSVERTFNVQILEREAKDVPIDLAAPAEPVVVVHATEPVPSQPAAPEPARPHRGPWLSVGIIGLSVGGVGLVLGAVTGAMSISQTNTISAQCTGGACPATLSDGRDTASALSNARALAIASDLGFIVGGVLAAAGVTFVVMGSMRPSSPSMALRVGPGTLQLVGRF